MPPKIRELERALLKAGFTKLGGKGSHRNYQHPSGVRLTIGGKPGQDAKHYQVRLVAKALEEAK